MLNVKVTKNIYLVMVTLMVSYLTVMVTFCLIHHLDLLGVIIVPVGHIIDVELVVLEVEPGVWPTSPDLI